MRQIDNLNESEREALEVKGMLPEKYQDCRSAAEIARQSQPPEQGSKHTWGANGFCIYCYNVHETDENARSTCSDGFACEGQGKPELPQGTPVMCNGYRGAIIRRYDGGMYEIRLERGVVCTDDFSVIETQPSEHSTLPVEPNMDFDPPYRFDDKYVPHEWENYVPEGVSVKITVTDDDCDTEVDTWEGKPEVNHAEKLAEAFRPVWKAWHAVPFDNNEMTKALRAMHAALAAWEGAQE